MGSACISDKHPPRHISSFQEGRRGKEPATNPRPSTVILQVPPDTHPPNTGMHAPTGPASDPEPLHPPAPDVRGMDQHGAWGRGDTCRRGCLRTAHRPGLHAGGRVEDRDHGSARGRAGMSPGRLAGWLLMVEHSCVVCAAGASPLHPPSTQTRRSGELHTSPDGT